MHVVHEPRDVLPDRICVVFLAEMQAFDAVPSYVRPRTTVRVVDGCEESRLRVKVELRQVLRRREPSAVVIDDAQRSAACNCWARGVVQGWFP